MTEDPAQSTDDAPWLPSTDPDEYTRDMVRPKDWVLESLLRIVTGFHDDGEGSFGVTVQSAGQTVSGTAISEEAYFMLLEGQLRAASGDTSDDWVDVVRDVMTQLGGRARERSKTRIERGLPVAARMHIHMKDVTIMNADGPLTLDLWRGALADVTGWALGSIKQ